MAQICVATNVFALVDDADWAEVQNVSRRWELSGHGYARIRVKKKVVFLHKLIYSFVDPAYQGIVDHDDQDKLNCQRYNLRPATHSQNRANGSIRVNNTSGVPGVSWCDRSQRWRVRVNFNGVKRFDECFPTLEEAVEARRKAAIELHGDFAKERPECV